MMRKLTALLLALLLLCGAAATAETKKEILKDDNGNKIGTVYYDYDDDSGKLTSKNTVYDEGYSEYIQYDSKGKVSGKTRTSKTGDNVYTFKNYDSDGKLTSEGTRVYHDDGTTENTEIVYYDSGTIKYINYYGTNSKGEFNLSFNEDGTLYVDAPYGNSTEKLYYDSDNGKWYNKTTGEEVDDPDLTEIAEELLKLLKKGKKVEPETIWYPNNTACASGICLRDEYPGLTDKWYNILPVDLSRDGIQQFNLVASNLYYLGDIQVTVVGDEVIVTYNYLKNSSFIIQPMDECVAWFTGVDQITGSFLENPTSDLKFGEAVSKETDLNGQDTALLFVCNRVTYRTPLNTQGAMPTRYWPNSDKLKGYFSGLRTLLAQNEAEYAEKKAEAESAAGE